MPYTQMCILGSYEFIKFIKSEGRRLLKIEDY